MRLKPKSSPLFALSAFTLAIGLSGCYSEDDPTPVVITPVVPDTYVATSGGKLLGFAASNPSAVVSVPLAVPASETLLGLDFRPSDGKLYALTKAGTGAKVYVLDPATGVFSGALALTNAAGAAAVTLAGTKYGVDFNPVADRLRVVGDNGENLRVNVAAATSNTTVDAALSTGLSEAAYTNAFSTSCQTDLYYLNATQLLLSAAPNGVATNAATPRLVGALGVTADANSGFDVRTTAAGNTLVAALKVGGAYGYYEIDASTGMATSKGSIPVASGENVIGLVTTLPAAGATPALAAGNMLAITAGATPALVTFNRPPSGSPAKLCSSSAITGLASGEAIVGADTRPKDGKLYALTKNAAVGKLYTIATTGVATSVATLAADAAQTSGAYAGLNGTNFGVDFNPIPDRLRVVSDTGQNLRVIVETVAGAAPAVTAGAVTNDTGLTTSGGTTARTGVTAVGYTNSIFGGNGVSLTTTLFGLDSATNALVRIGSDPANGTAGDPGNPNAGVVNAVANLTSDGTAAIDIGDVNAFDIIGGNGAALMAATVGANTTLYTVNLGSGVATAAGNFAAPVVAMGTNGALTATVFGVTTSNKLVSFLPSTPATVQALGTISVPAGETVLGLDFRPSVGPKNGQLVALTSAGKLYIVDPVSGAASALSTLAGAAGSTLTFPGTGEHGIDFNPLPDRLRVVNETAQNLRINVDSGSTTVDTNLNKTGVFGAAYSNNFATAGATTLYYLMDAGAANSSLQTTADPNGGALTVVGTDLGADYSKIGDLDIAGGHNGFVLAALQPAAGGVSGLYRINLTTGAATKVADIAAAGSEALRGIAIQVK